MWRVREKGNYIVSAGLDTSIANVALPTISPRLSISPVDAIWIVNSYQLDLSGVTF
jgi:DHA2 family multidrug resistance protein-like MFS transporter